MDKVFIIPALGDNFIYLCQIDQSNAIVIDPGDSSPVLQTLDKHNLTLTAVLATHHHWDHVGGIAELKKRTGCKVIGGDKQRIPGIDFFVEDGQILTFGNTKIEVLATAGHTRTAVCYYRQPTNDSETGILWTGDTMFVGGCGRLLECDAQSMWNSLQRLAALPDRTLLYCGHDYTLENYEFALRIEPNNQVVEKRLGEIRQKQQLGEYTVPSTMSQEKSTNPFLRAKTNQIKASLNMPQAGDMETFAELRRRKDMF
jgi:hydroxyacylglutathione hydrolase